ncbi:MAG TPA: DegT/DnrJ/EryC1/StrS family aminotransferase [Dehalococcoidia bacterium]|nr:DegT/DnrJ/EryC1/StrS family aminotransferase [Dehalococcoidia bacterium]
MTQTLIPVIDLRRQYESMKDTINAAVLRVVDSCRYISGPETEAFEREFAAYCGAKHCVALGSGTAAISLSLRGLGVKPGDEVISVGFTVSPTLDAIRDLGAVPVFVDVDPSTYTLDPTHLESRISPATRAIVPVHIYGHPADMDAILAVAGRYGLPVVSDACEAHGALYKGRPISVFGTASCFSFYPTKNLNAMGDTGAVVTDDSELADQLRLLRYHGWDGRFHSAVSSTNSRMDEIQAAVLTAKLPSLDAWNDRRREIAHRYDLALADSDIVRPAARAEWAVPSYYLYVVTTSKREELRCALTEAGIASDIHWPEPPHLQPAFSDLGYSRGTLPVTERLCDEVLTLPMYAELTDDEVDSICATLRSFARG